MAQSYKILLNHLNLNSVIDVPTQKECSALNKEYQKFKALKSS